MDPNRLRYFSNQTNIDLNEASAYLNGSKAILDNVMRQMLGSVANQSINVLVNEYMRNRSRRAILAGDDPYDPIARLANEMMDRVMR